MGESDASVRLTKNKQHILMSLSHYRATPLFEIIIIIILKATLNKQKKKKKKKKKDFLTTHPILSLSSPDHFQTISSGKSTAFFSSILVQVCRPQKHLTVPTNRSSVTAPAEFIFKRNVGLLHKMFH